jgi:hypothetical protein
VVYWSYWSCDIFSRQWWISVATLRFMLSSINRYPPFAPRHL